jgi:hypothetical protein
MCKIIAGTQLTGSRIPHAEDDVANSCADDVLWRTFQARALGAPAELRGRAQARFGVDGIAMKAKQAIEVGQGVCKIDHKYSCMTL